MLKYFMALQEIKRKFKDEVKFKFGYNGTTYVIHLSYKDGLFQTKSSFINDETIPSNVRHFVDNTLNTERPYNYINDNYRLSSPYFLKDRDYDNFILFLKSLGITKITDELSEIYNAGITLYVYKPDMVSLYKTSSIEGLSIEKMKNVSIKKTGRKHFISLLFKKGNYDTILYKKLVKTRQSSSNPYGYVRLSSKSYRNDERELEEESILNSIFIYPEISTIVMPNVFNFLPLYNGNNNSKKVLQFIKRVLTKAVEKEKTFWASLFPNATKEDIDKLKMFNLLKFSLGEKMISISEDIKKLKREIEEDTINLKKKYTILEEKENLISNWKNYSIKKEKNIMKKIANLKKLPFVRDVSFSPETISILITFKPTFLKTEEDNYEIYIQIGELKFNINLISGKIEISETGISFRDFSDSHPHPHSSATGHPCFGNYDIDKKILEMVITSDFEKLAYVIWNWINTYIPESAYLGVSRAIEAQLLKGYHIWIKEKKTNKVEECNVMNFEYKLINKTFSFSPLRVSLSSLSEENLIKVKRRIEEYSKIVPLQLVSYYKSKENTEVNENESKSSN